jgi:hypothetical protein
MKIRHLVWACLLLTLANGAGPALGETEYYAVFVEGKKAGHGIRSRLVADGKVTSTEMVSITLSRGNIPMTMTMTETGIETVTGKPLGFESVQDYGMMAMKTVGTVSEDGTVTMTTVGMGEQMKDSIEWPSGAVMAEGLHLFQKKKGLKEGLKYVVNVFSPQMREAIDVQISVGPKRNVDLLGRVVALTEVISTINTPTTGEIVSTEYVDEDFRTQKAVTPVMNMVIETIACAKEFALGENDVPELINKMFVASPAPLEDVNSAESIVYYLSPLPEVNDLNLPSSDNQSVRRGKEGRLILTVKPAVAPAGAAFPYKGKDKKILAALKPSRFVQSNDKRIVALARKAVGDTKDASEAVKRIEAFVAKYISNKSLSVGYASAAEVAASRQGDCTEFAVLTAAMCRAVGIPAQVVTGLAYIKNFAGIKNSFGCHAWTQAYVGGDPASAGGGRWVGLDSAFKSSKLGGYDAGHIALAVGNGEPAGFLGLVTTLGRFKIERVVVNKAAK